MPTSGITISNIVTVRDSSGVLQNKVLITDTTVWGVTGIDYINIKATSPTGVTFFAHGSGVGIAKNGNISISMPVDVDSEITKGVYTYILTVKKTGDVTLYSDTYTYDYQYSSPTVSITELVDGYTSIFSSTDSTNYATAVVTRTHSVTPPVGSGMATQSGASATYSYAPNIWSGDYVLSIVSLLSATFTNYSISDRVTGSKTVTVKFITEDIEFTAYNAYVELYETRLTSNPTLAHTMEPYLLLLASLTTRYMKYAKDGDNLDAYEALVSMDAILNPSASDVVAEILPFVNGSIVGDGTVKMDASDSLGYLANKLDGVTIAPNGSKKAAVLNSPKLGGALANLFARLLSPVFTGTPTAPTPATSDNSQKLATTAFVKSNLTGIDAATLQGNAPAAFATAAQGIKADNALPAASYTKEDILTKLQAILAPLNLSVTQLNGKVSTDFALAVHNQAETTISFTDNTTGNASASSHGYQAKLPNDPNKFQDGTGVWRIPSTFTGADGRSVALRVNGVNLEWQWTTGPDLTWKNLGKVIYADGASAYVYIAHASDNAGTGFTLVDDPALNYISIITTTSPIASPTFANFPVWHYIGPKFGEFGLYTITLPVGPSVANRIAGAVSGVDYPTGWSLSVYGGNPNDLVITHNLSKRTASCTLFTVSGGVETQKVGTAAYTDLVGESLNQTRIAGLSQYPAPLVLHLMFS